LFSLAFDLSQMVREGILVSSSRADAQVEIGYKKQKGIEISLDTLVNWLS